MVYTGCSEATDEEQCFKKSSAIIFKYPVASALCE